MFSTAFLDIPALECAFGTVVLPGSKSISNRVLLLAAMSEGTTTVHDLLDSDDTQVMLDALHTLGFNALRDVHVGRYLVIEMAAADATAAETAVREMCARLLANPVTEDFEIAAVTAA